MPARAPCFWRSTGSRPFTSGCSSVRTTRSISSSEGSRATPGSTGSSQRFVSLFEPNPYVYLVLAVLVVALLRGRPRIVLAVGAIILGANLTTEVLKHVIAAPQIGVAVCRRGLVAPHALVAQRAFDRGDVAGARIGARGAGSPAPGGGGARRGAGGCRRLFAPDPARPLSQRRTRRVPGRSDLGAVRGGGAGSRRALAAVETGEQRSDLSAGRAGCPRRGARRRAAGGRDPGCQRSARRCGLRPGARGVRARRGRGRGAQPRAVDRGAAGRARLRGASYRVLRPGSDPVPTGARRRDWRPG